MSEFASALPTREQRVLLEELNHRISNEFFSAMNLVSLAAARSDSDEVKVALSGVSELLRHYADVHQALQAPADGARVDASSYLRRLCLSIKRSKLDQMEIDLVLAARPLVLRADQCWLLGMIVYELITNAAKHAFLGRNGEIRVELLRAVTSVECKVLDNGSAPTNVQRGCGLKILGELIKPLGGRFEQKLGAAGSISAVVFPYIEGSAPSQKELHLAASQPPLRSLENPHSVNRDLMEGPFYRFSTPPRFHTTKTQRRHRCIAAKLSLAVIQSSRRQQLVALKAQ